MKYFFTSVAVFSALFTCVQSAEQLSCEYTEGRVFSCVVADTNQPLKNCSMCRHFTDVSCSTLLKENCAGYLDCQQRIQGHYGDTRIAVIFSLSPSHNRTCESKSLKQFVKPGPVRRLLVTAVNETYLSVDWLKPNDYDNAEIAYLYNIVVDTGQDRKEINVSSTSATNVSRLVELVTPWRNVSVTVRGKMMDIGLYGALSTTYLLREPVPILKAEASNESRKVIILLVVFPVIFLVAVMVICFRKRKSVFSKITISLPKQLEEEETSHLTSTTHESTFSKKTRDEGQPCPDSGHFSMEANSEYDHNRTNTHDRNDRSVADVGVGVDADANADAPGEPLVFVPTEILSAQEDWLEASGVSEGRLVPMTAICGQSSNSLNQSMESDLSRSQADNNMCTPYASFDEASHVFDDRWQNCEVPQANYLENVAHKGNCENPPLLSKSTESLSSSLSYLASSSAASDDDSVTSYAGVTLTSADNPQC